MTAANVIPFAFEENLVRVVKPNGEPWFVGKDVCQILEIRDHHQALERLDDDEKGGYNVPTPQGEQSVICVSEPGVYRLIFTSRKPQAERFKRFLAHDVLPALRRQGFYGELPAGETLLEFPAEDRALSEHIAKLQTVRECRLIHGSRAAARLWRRLGLPQVAESAVDQDDEGRECLAHLLAFRAGENSDFPLGRLIRIALADDLAAQAALLEHWDLRIGSENGEEGLVVPNWSMPLARVFAGSKWDKAHWRFALRRLAQARPSGRYSYGSTQRRGTFIPTDLIDMMDVPAMTE